MRLANSYRLPRQRLTMGSFEQARAPLMRRRRRAQPFYVSRSSVPNSLILLQAQDSSCISAAKHDCCGALRCESARRSGAGMWRIRSLPSASEMEGPENLRAICPRDEETTTKNSEKRVLPLMPRMRSTLEIDHCVEAF